jgi:hypothetical protein
MFYNHDHALYLAASNTTIINNIFYNNLSGNNIKVDGYQPANGVNNWKIINNTFYNYGTQNVEIYGHIMIWGKCTNVLIQNNISHTVPPGGFITQHYVTPDDDTVTVKNNLVYGTNCYVNRSSFTCYYPPTVPTGWTFSGNILNQDPKFVDLINKNFHILSTSPAINKGLEYNKRTYDADGQPIVGMPDIGAYEAGGVSEDTTPPAPPEIIEVK